MARTPVPHECPPLTSAHAANHVRAVGAVAVFDPPQKEDHALVVQGLERYLTG
ncbi:hypothetical protein [Streptomyces sp. NPDC003077]|uniref:hypothetical protein n=1 Tax=Streptomyces sp. NPDC003077 TaxID=3154443 RepID=UPI0033AC5640